MSNVVTSPTRFASATSSALATLDKWTTALRTLPQIEFTTEHVLHGGMYARSLVLPPRALCTAVLIKPATILISVGDVDFWFNDEIKSFTGYNVIPGSPMRRVALFTRSMVGLSMIFPSAAKTVEEVQREFTDQVELLVPLSEIKRHKIVITGE